MYIILPKTPAVMPPRMAASVLNNSCLRIKNNEREGLLHYSQLFPLNLEFYTHFTQSLQHLR